jgi:hypothetical protein
VQEESTIIQEHVPQGNLHRYKQKCLYLKLNCYGDNDAIKMFPSYGSTYYTCLTVCVIHMLHKSDLESIAKPSLVEGRVLCKVLGTQKIIFM